MVLSVLQTCACSVLAAHVWTRGQTDGARCVRVVYALWYVCIVRTLFLVRVLTIFSIIMMMVKTLLSVVYCTTRATMLCVRRLRYRRVGVSGKTFRNELKLTLLLYFSHTNWTKF